MTGFIIVLLILLIIALLLLVRVKLQIDNDRDDIRLRLKVLGIPFTISPKKEKSQKIKLRDYSYRSMQRKKRKAEKEKIKGEKKEEKKAPEKEKTPLKDKISDIFPIVKKLISRFFRYLRVDVTKIYVNVASDDAARTAILYGIITQAVAALLDLTSSLPNIRAGYKADIAVNPDFASDKISADIDVSFSIMVWQALSALAGAAVGYIKNQNKNK